MKFAYVRNYLFIFLAAICFSARANVQANFTATQFAGCPPLNTTFTDASTGNVTSWFWDFGNGNTSVKKNPSATFLSSGFYQVKLVVSDGATTDSITKTVQVFVLPTVNFSAQNPKACLLDTVRFISNVKPGNAPVVSYAWGFGDGKASSVQNAAYQYSAPGTYNITLVVQDSNGCNANKTVPFYVTIYPMPQAAFTASPAQSCNLTQLVTFTNNSTGAGLTYQWSLDAGVTSTLANPTHTYNDESYNVILLVTDTNGCKSSARQKVIVQQLVANFKTPSTKPCTGQNVNFQNTSNFPGTSWFWDLGDGLTSTSQNPTVVYKDTGTYAVKLVIHDGSCVDSITKTAYIHVIQGFSTNTPTFGTDSTISCGQPITINFNNTTPGTSSVDTFLWTFGNGDTSSSQNPSETYNQPGNYTVTLTITDTNGCTITVSAGGLVQASPPIPKFIVSGNGCPGTPISFPNHSINAAAFLWNFGDGDTSTQKLPTHVYAKPGVYSVTLTAYGPAGCDSTITMVNAVTIGAVTASFVVQDSFSPCPPFVTIFKNTTPAGVGSFLWNFGDGYTDTTTNPTHIYYHPGVFTVSLLAWESKTCNDTTVRPNLITVQGPVGLFNITPQSGCVPVQVNVTSTMANTVKTFYCDMGDGNVINDTADFVHTYYQPRAYYPQFILTDYAGCTVAYPLDTINTHGHPVIQLHDTSVCTGMAAPLTIKADSASYTYTWFPANNVSCDTCQSVIINSPDSAVYKVVATNQWGCETTDSLRLNVVPYPVLNDTASFKLCKGDGITIAAGSPQYKYAWSPALYLSDSSVSAPLCSPLSTVSYTVSAFNALGCASQTSYTVNVSDKVEVTIPGDTMACSFGTLQLQANVVYGSDLGVQYSWSPTEIVNNPNIFNPEVSVGGKTEKLTLIATSGHCIPDTVSTTITVLQRPDIEVSANVTTTPGAEVPVYADSHQELNYQWTSKDSISCADCRRTDVFPTSTQVVYVTGTNSHGCSATDSLIITVESCNGKAIYMPNTFTPNGDGIDDKFFIRTTALGTLKYFRIFDSWGKEVFETDNINEGWDGTINGKPAPIAVYVYELEGECQDGNSVFKSGNVTAIR
jgi:gliding motility-associated-like protein